MTIGFYPVILLRNMSPSDSLVPSYNLLHAAAIQEKNIRRKFLDGTIFLIVNIRMKLEEILVNKHVSRVLS